MLTTADQLAQLLTDPSVRFDLFPGGYFQVTYSCYEASPQSAYEIWNERRWVSVGSVDGRPASLAIMSTYPVLSGTSCNIDLYGYIDIDTAIAHFKMHFPHIKECLNTYGGKLTIFLTIPYHCIIQPFVELFHNQLKLSDGGFGVFRNIGPVQNNPQVQLLNL